jgi:hypothetical protein
MRVAVVEPEPFDWQGTRPWGQNYCARQLLSPSATVPMVGASGAIAGVLGAYLLTRRRYARTNSMVVLGVGRPSGKTGK